MTAHDHRAYYTWQRMSNNFIPCSDEAFFDGKVSGERGVSAAFVPDFADLAQKAGFDYESTMFDLHVYTKGDLFLFCFINFEYWAAVRVEGMLDYICFIKEWANPFVQYQKLVYKNI